MRHQLSLKTLAQPLLESIAIGLLGAVGTATLGVAPLFAQTISANDLSKTVSPFCQVMSSGASPWGYAENLFPALQVAIEQGGDLNQLCDFYGVQILPLNFLVSTDVVLAQQLIERGVDVNAHDSQGDTPLHYVGASVETAQLLIERGANINAQNNNGITPLHNILGEKSIAVMALLIKRGADVTAATPEGITPLHFAYNFPTGDGAALLISKGADVNARTTENVTPLYSALSFPKVVAQLLQAGADPNIENRQGAAIHSVDMSPDVLQLLLAAGVDVNVRDSLGRTALHKQQQNFEMVPLLLAAGADVNAQDIGGKTPLFGANLQVAEQLLAAGAKLNIQDSSGWTPLHHVVWQEQSNFGPELVELFLSEGADTTIQNNQGETVLDMAQKLSRSNIVGLFPSESGTLVGDETTDSEVTDPSLSNEVQRQVQDLLQSARGEGQSRKTALSQLSQAAELAQTISDAASRDRLLQDIGLGLVELNALAEAEAITQTISYGAYGYEYGSRPELERAIIKAYIQSGQTPQAVSIAENTPSDRRNNYWMAVIDALADQNLLVEAAALLDRFTGDSSLDDYQRYQAISRINQVYIDAEQFEQSQVFLQTRSLKHPGDEVSALRATTLWAGRAGQLETALAVARQIPANERDRTFIDLARLYHYQGQQAQAKSLLDEVRKLPPADITQDWQKQSVFDLATSLAAGYADVGLTETAREVLTDAERNFSPSSGSYPSYKLVDVFARIGAFDRAIQLVDSAPSSQRHAARLSLAKVYTDRGDYDLAITTLSQMPNSALLPYRERRQKLFERIVGETLKQKNVRRAKRAAQLIEDPTDSVSTWLKISAFYRAQQPQNAIEILDRLATNESSTAVSLVEIAQEYWALGQREQAIETAEAAISFIQNLQPAPWSPSYPNRDGGGELEAIAKLGRNWQAPELQAAAVREIETRIEAAASDELPLIGIDSAYKLVSLVELAYNPNQAPSDLFNRNLTRLETAFEQAPDSYRLSVLDSMASLYSNINRPDEALVAIAEILPLIAVLPDENQRTHYYSRVAGFTIQNDDLEAQLKALPHLSIGQRLEVLTGLVQRAAGEDDTARTMQYFDQLIQLSQSQSQGDLDYLLLSLAYKYEDNRDPNGFYAAPLPLTSAAIALLMRLPQHISDPYQQIGAWSIINRRALPPVETDKAYEALHAKIKEIPDSYRKREMLWSELENLLNNQDFDRATRMAYQLEDAYRRTALGWIETVRQAE